MSNGKTRVKKTVILLAGPATAHVWKSQCLQMISILGLKKKRFKKKKVHSFWHCYLLLSVLYCRENYGLKIRAPYKLNNTGLNPFYFPGIFLP